jgi:tetratricopeptide (TPR) repeat protein
MKNNQNPDTDSVLVAAMGKRLPDRTHFKSVIKLYDEEVKKSNDLAGALARRAIARCMAIHTGDLDASEIEKCRSDVYEAMKINKELTIVQIAEGCYYYYCLKDFTSAITSFKIASEMDPHGYKPLFYLAMIYKAMGKWNELESLLEKFGKFKIRNPLSLTNIGLCYDYLHEFDKALDYHQQAIEAKPGWPAAYMNKLYTLLLKGNTPEARSVLGTLIEISGEENIEYQITLDIYERKYSDAFSKATKAKPEDFSDKGERNLYLGNLSLLLDDKINSDKYLDLALDELNNELIAQPGNAEIHYLTGIAHALKGNKSQALEKVKDAVRIAEKANSKTLESEMQTNSAKIHATVGMNQEAIKEIDEILSNPSLFSTKLLQLDPVWKPLLTSPELKPIIAKYDK